MSIDNDPLGFQEAAEQKWAILKRRLWRWGFPPAAVGLVAGTGWFLYRVWEWVLR